jgi:hypothetical protein
MSTGGKVCAETTSVREKLSRPAKNASTTPQHPGETFSQLPIRTNFIPVLPSCEKWQLEVQSNYAGFDLFACLNSFFAVFGLSAGLKAIGQKSGGKFF